MKRPAPLLRTGTPTAGRVEWRWLPPGTTMNGWPVSFERPRLISGSCSASAAALRRIGGDTIDVVMGANASGDLAPFGVPSTGGAPSVSSRLLARPYHSILEHTSQYVTRRLSHL